MNVHACVEPESSGDESDWRDPRDDGDAPPFSGLPFQARDEPLTQLWNMALLPHLLPPRKSAGLLSLGFHRVMLAAGGFDGR